MTSALIQCDEAPVPQVLQSYGWDKHCSINCQGSKNGLTLRVQSVSHALRANVDSRSADLVRIAAYAYAADQMVRRGGPKDLYAKRWQRHFALAVSVNDPSFWGDQEVRAQLTDTLGFVSDDHWEFAFSRATPRPAQLVMEPGGHHLIGTPDSVVLFSGGADSLCATIESVTLDGKRPVLVSHRSTPPISSQQQHLVAELRRLFPSWEFPHVSVWVHRMGSEALETTQRTRSFLYASIGAAVAHSLSLSDVILADNGVVSLNLPINGSIIGAQATRSTHPKFLGLFNRLVSLVLDGGIAVTNPLWARTRPEVLSILSSAGVPHLLQETISCSSRRGATLAKPHCGVCSQCIDRRFATLAARMEEHDLPERYEVDIFRDSLAEGNQRTMAESYVGFALKVRDTQPEHMFDEYPQLADCLLPTDPHPGRTAEQLIDLLIRHAKTVIHVMGEQVGHCTDDLVSGTLPESSLVRLVVSGKHLEDIRARVIDKLVGALSGGLPPIFRSHKPKDEREVQDAAEGIISVLEDDLYREVPLLPFAGISMKPDFAQLPDRGHGWLFVEMKYVSSRRRLNGIVTEITSRTVIYRRQGASVLFCVYDRDHNIPNDQQFTRDCASEDGIWVAIVR